ncbi:MAG TPA: DUF502 domain-containing protein [Arcobacter sp.]|nr:DUF502 domain-containing protein [Arcobacter sp.]HIP56313.1 DUF502 domain-containing protein [Arcobacter sp.]
MKKSPLKHFFDVTLQGIFWILPIVAIIMIILWVYNKIDMLANSIFGLVGFAPEHNEFLWVLIVVVLLVFVLYVVGHLMETRLANIFEALFSKIPVYSTLKDIIGIFNSSKQGENKVLVVVVKGFASQGYNIGLMYSQKESIMKDHYTVTLSQTPIPNGGYLFEVHKDNIFILEDASFDDNLQYLLSMGVKSFADITKTSPKDINELDNISKWLEKNTKN